MALLHHIYSQAIHQTLLSTALNAIHPTQYVSVNLAAQPARHYTNATIVRNRSIILNVIKKCPLII